MMSKVGEAVLKNLPKYKDNEKCWNNTQNVLKCCGVNGYKDWDFGKNGKYEY